MAFNDYVQARRLGLKAAQQKTAAQESPYLAALDEKVEKVNGYPHISLGLIQIPVQRIIGTFSKGRTNAFAANFMPLLEARSEFGLKWSSLFDGVIQDGVLHPIKVVEYRNWYYVIEGNKRVSVMKYLGTDYAEAEVTRILAPHTDDREGRVYAAYLQWYQDTKINTIYFTKEGSFEKLYELTGHEPGEKWTADEAKDMQAAYLRFAEVYHSLYGDLIDLEPGDAFVLYLKVYGYDPSRLPTEIEAELAALRGELQKDGQQEQVALIMEPEEQKSGLFDVLFAPSLIKAAFLYHRSPRDSGWNYWHELGRINAKNALGDKLEHTVHVCMEMDEFEPAMEKLIADGNQIIFATSPLMLDATIRVSLKYPNVHILNCSLLASYYHVRSYYLRIYEAKFLIGMIAGAMADNNEVGYITDYPIYGVPSSINAFALGARMVNPRARVHLEWSTRKGFDPENPFPGQDVRIISNRDISAPKHSSKVYGLYRVEEDGELTNLALPLWDWSKFYIPIIRSVLSGTFVSDAKGKWALDYWWGMSSDALDVIVSTKFDPYLLRLINTVHSQMQAGQFWPFEGLLVSQDGTVRCGTQSHLTPPDVIAMDWLLDNVVGSFPEKEELCEHVWPIVEMQGLMEIPKIDKSMFNWKEK
ncbi:MAG: BMP family ABC transporter substrate-binding protein [Eubacteriales bacterium]|nr:BMP family ABC transporter substrate-binding protein [Eubacteriales bacterium]